MKEGEVSGYIFDIQKFCLHDGDGIRTNVFFSGCNLRCLWCANPESRPSSHSGENNARKMTVGEVVGEVLKDKAFYDKSGGGVTLTGGEVFLQFGFAEKLCTALHKEKIHIALETAGCVPQRDFIALCDLADFVFIDCKHYDEAKHVAGTGVSNAPILRNITWLARSGKACCVRIPVIPAYNDKTEDAQAFCELFQTLGVRRVQLLPFHQFGEKKYENLGLDYAYRGVPQLHKEDLHDYLKIFEKSGFDAAIGG